MDPKDLDIEIDAADIPAPLAAEGDTKAPAPAQEAPAEGKDAPLDNTSVPASFADLQEEVTTGEVKPKEAAPAKADEDPAVKKDDKEQNFANLRKSLKTKEDEISNMRKELADKGALELTAEEYKTKTETLQEAVDAAQAEIDALSPYRDAVDITRNPVYQQKFVKPIKDMEANIVQEARQYGLNDEQLKEAVAQPNLAGLENKLAEFGVTSSGIMSIIGSFKQMATLKREEAEYSKDKKGFLSTLNKEFETSRDAELNKISETISSTKDLVYNSAWDFYRQEGVKGMYPTMQKTGNKNWDAVIQQTQDLGSQMYSDTLSDIESCIKSRTITPGVMDKLGKMAAHTADNAKNQKVVITLQETVKRQADEIAMLRGDNPDLGNSSTVARTSGGSKTPPSFAEIAAELN